LRGAGIGSYLPADSHRDREEEERASKKRKMNKQIHDVPAESFY
jgi:hypothetical protein